MIFFIDRIKIKKLLYFLSFLIILLFAFNNAFSKEIIQYIKKREAFIKLLEKNVVPFIKKNKKKSPKCFISYAWGDQYYEELVEDLAEILKKSGVEVFFDRWEDKKGKEIFNFINKIEEADFILVIGTELYLKKYNKMAKSEKEKEHFVKFEANLIDYMLSRSLESNKKVIPIILEGTSETSLPFLRTKAPCDLVQNDYFQELLLLIRDLWEIDNVDLIFNGFIKNFKKTSNIIDNKYQSIVDKNMNYELQKVKEENKILKAQIEELKKKIQLILKKRDS